MAPLDDDLMQSLPSVAGCVANWGTMAPAFADNAQPSSVGLVRDVGGGGRRHATPPYSLAGHGVGSLVAFLAHTRRS